VQKTTIPLDNLLNHIKQQQDELQKLKEEIEKLGAILEWKNVDIQTIDEYKKLEEDLEKYGFSMESPRKLVSVLLKINQLGYDALKIIKELARIKSLKHTERLLKNNCITLESCAARYKQLLPL